MDVEAIEFEPFTYNVKSRTTPGHHRVFLPDSACSCIGWTTRQKNYRKRTGKDFECAHIKAAWESLKDDIKLVHGTKPKMILAACKPSPTVDARNHGEQ